MTKKGQARYAAGLDFCTTRVWGAAGVRGCGKEEERRVMRGVQQEFSYIASDLNELMVCCRRNQVIEEVKAAGSSFE